MSLHMPTPWAEAEKQGVRLRGEGRLEDAARVYRTALERFAGNPALLNGLGLVFMDANHPREARMVFEEALQRSPESPELLFNLGNAMRAGADPVGAIGMYQRALSLGPDRPELFNNLGVSFQECERWEDALDAFHRALRCDPGYLPALANSGYSMIQVGRPEDAVGVLRRAIQLQPEYADAHWLLSHALLVTGQWPEGWDEYEWRWQQMKKVPYHRGGSGSRWRGEDVAGKRVLLYAEQGMGDAVQFVRYVPRIAAMGATVSVECHPELVPLFRCMDGVASVHARGVELPAFDIVCPFLSLPSVFRTTLDTIPGGDPYLRPDPVRAGEWRRALDASAGGVHVGLVWAGSAAHANDRRRSLDGGKLGVLGSVPDVHFVSLQKGGGDGGPGGSVVMSDWTGDLHDFGDTAALISQLDLVISVDTAVAHVAGAVGTPVWVLLPFAPDWRWQQEGERTPWYRSMRLFRQSYPGGWDGVISALFRELLQVSRRSF